VSPGLTSQAVMMPSVTDSPSWGSWTSATGCSSVLIVLGRRADGVQQGHRASWTMTRVPTGER